MIDGGEDCIYLDLEKTTMENCPISDNIKKPTRNFNNRTVSIKLVNGSDKKITNDTRNDLDEGHTRNQLRIFHSYLKMYLIFIRNILISENNEFLENYRQLGLTTVFLSGILKSESCQNLKEEASKILNQIYFASYNLNFCPSILNIK